MSEQAVSGGRTFGLVLGAGGTAGEAFHRGVIRAMDELGWDARSAAVIVGTSAGSIVAAGLRHQGPAPQISSSTAESRRRVPSRAAALAAVRRPRQALSALLLSPQLARGTRTTDFISGGLRRRHGLDWPEAPLWIVAVRRSDGKRTVFGQPDAPKTDVASAVAASCAVPGYFAALDIDGSAYVDGAVHSPTNADLLAGLDLDSVIISSPMSLHARGLRPRIDHPLRQLFGWYLSHEVWTLRRRGTRVITLEPDRAVLAAMGLNMMSARGYDDIEAAAYELALKRLPAGVTGAESTVGCAKLKTE